MENDKAGLERGKKEVILTEAMKYLPILEDLQSTSDELAKSLHAVLDVLKSYDNGENCPSCGEEYTDESPCQNEEDCYLVQAENLLANVGRKIIKYDI